MPDRNDDDLLAQEYLQLQKTIEDFDARALTIKAWSVTFSAAGLGIAYQQHNPTLLLVAASSALVFWIVEAVWKGHQRAYYPRIVAIETYFEERKLGTLAPFQIHKSWRESFEGKRSGSFLRRLTAPFFDFVDAPAQEDTVLRRLAVLFFAGVFLPHLLIAATGFYLFYFHPPQTGGSDLLASITIAGPQQPHR